MVTDQLLTKTEDWKALLKRLHLEDIKAKSPEFFKLSGEYKMKVAPYRDDTTNGLTKCVANYLKFQGYYCNRISVMGTARKEVVELAHGRKIERIKYTPSMTNKGSSDLLAIIRGLAISIEIKCSATKDRQREDQKKEQIKIEKAGGIYLIVKDFPQFLEWYNQFNK